MIKYFVCSDVHGFYSIFKLTLKEIGFDFNNKEHKIILLGDAFDRGSEAVKLFKFLRELNNQERLIYIKGNHENLLFDCVTELQDFEGCASYHHYTNGTVDTIMQFKQANLLNNVLNFISDNCINYYELNNYIFVHGWIPKVEKYEDLKNCTNEQWKEAAWINGMEANFWNEGLKNKTIVCGHYHTSYGNFHYLNKGTGEFTDNACFDIYESKGIIALDACTAFSKKMNILVLEI